MAMRVRSGLVVLLAVTCSTVCVGQDEIRNLLADGSFESMTPELHKWAHKSDGGGGQWAIVPAVDAPHGKHILRMIQWLGSHTILSPVFIPQFETVTLSVFVRDNGFENQSGQQLPEGDADFVFGLREVATGEQQPLVEGQVSNYPQWTRLSSEPATVAAGQEYQAYFYFNPYVGNQLLDIDAIQVEAGPQATGFAGREYVYKFVDAENLQFTEDSGWRAVEGTGADIYEPVSRNHVLAGGNPDQPASINVDIPVTGDYLLYVKLLKQNRLHAPFRGVVEQNGQVVLDEWYHCTNREGDRDGGYWYWRWETSQGTARLKAGKATISLIPGAGPEDMPKTGHGIRDLDCLLLTTDPAYQPNHYHFAPKVFVRVTVTPTPAHPYYLTLHIHHRKTTGSYYERPGYVSAGGFLPSVLGFISPGETTGWFEMTKYLRETLNIFWMEVMLEGEQEVERVKAVIEISRQPNGPADFTIEEDLGGDHISVILPGNLEKYAEWVMGPEELVEKHEAMLADLDFPENTRPRLLSLETYLIGYGSAYVDSDLRDRELAVLGKLGFNTLWGSGLTAEAGQRFGIDRLRLMDFLNYKFIPRADLPAHADEYWANSAQRWSERVEKPPCFIKLGDESGSFFNRVKDNEEALVDFRLWLQERDLVPEDFGCESWDEVGFIDRSETMSLEDKALYYHRCLYAHEYDAIYHGEATRAIERQFPTPTPLTMMNYTPHILGHGCWIPGYPDWLTMARLRGTTINWSEDWQSWSGWYAGEQMTSLIADILRSGSRYHGQPVGFYAIYNTDPEHFERKVYSAITHGAKTVAYYTYGPMPYTSEVSFSEDRQAMRRIARFNHALGAVDDLLYYGMPRKPQVAILISQPSGYWKTSDGSGADLRCTYMALLHSQIPVDFLEETDIENGFLDEYKALYMFAPNITREAGELVEQWVKRGGMLVASAGSGMRDELDEPLDTLRPVFGIEEWEMLEMRNVGRDKLELPRLKPLDSVTLISQAPYAGLVFEVLSWKQRLVPTEGAQVVGSFSDGEPAAIYNKYGQGQTLYFGALPGVAYMWSAKPSRSEPTTAYQDMPRRVCALGFELAGLQRPVEVSEPLVEAVVLESERGIVVPLINWTERDLEAVTVRLHNPGGHTQVGTVHHPHIPVKSGDGWLEVTVRLRETDLLYLRR